MASSSSRVCARKNIANVSMIPEFEENFNFENYVADDFGGQEK